MTGRRCFLPVFLLFIAISSHAQRIVYSEPDREDSRRMNFEIVGKIGGNFQVYKSIRNKSWISVLNNDMKEITRVEQDFLPENDRMINTDFFAYGDFSYMIFQYRKRNIIYCAAAKIDANGQKVGEIMELDTTQVNFNADNKIYTVLSSEDKKKLMVFKLNSKNKRHYVLTTVLLNDKLELQKKSRMGVPMDDRDDYVNEFHLDNDGDLVFSKFARINNENVGAAAFVIKAADADTLQYHWLVPNDKLYFDEIRIKPDNYNKRYFLTSFYFTQRRGNVEGYYMYVWDKATGNVVIEDTVAFSDELRREARGQSSTRSAFNDYFIKQIIPRRDGGVIIASEAIYTTSRGGGWNRWNNLYGSPFMRNFDYYYYSPYSMYSPWGMGRGWNDYQNVRYQADNVVISSFDKSGKKEWNSVISKQQFDDQSDDLISYNLLNTGGALHFIFNNMERRVQILNDFTLHPDGKIDRNPTLKNLDRGYDFMPKYAKQVSSRQVIIPCIYRNYICFAKLDYN